MGFSSDSRNALTVDGDYYFGGDDLGSIYYNIQVGGWLSEALRLTIYPGFEVNSEKA